MVLPSQMTFIATDGAGAPEVMKPATGPLPVPKPDEILIRVLAAGVNRPDIAQRQGSYPPPPGAWPSSTPSPYPSLSESPQLEPRRHYLLVGVIWPPSTRNCPVTQAVSVEHPAPQGKIVHDRPPMLAVGVMIWLGSELMFFSGLFAAFFTIRANTIGPWPPRGARSSSPAT